MLELRVCEMLELVSNSLRSGFALLQAFELAAKQLKPPLSDELDALVSDLTGPSVLTLDLPGELRSDVDPLVHSNGSSGLVPSGQDEVLIQQMMNRAGGIPTQYDDLSLLISPRASRNTVLLRLVPKASWSCF